METVLRLENVSKTYYGDEGSIIKANDQVNFTLKKGEIHALLGENGAGKSTLVKNLTRRPDTGKIYIRDNEVLIENPIDTLEHGIGIAHQDLSKSLIERHSIAENLLSIVRGNLFSIKQIEAEIVKTLQKYNLSELNPSAKIWKLSGGEKQRVEILKALITDPSILILDEPTSMLTPNETDKLFTLLKNLKENGKSILLITHHLEEAIIISDRITVMRQGKVVAVLDDEKVKHYKQNMELGFHELATHMVGREVLFDYEKTAEAAENGKKMLEIRNLVVNNDMGDKVIHELDLLVKSGQILGLAGIAGNGQRELVEAILHLRKPVSGIIKIKGVEVSQKSIREIRNLGVSYIPENRSKGIVNDLSVRENLLLNMYSSSKGPFIQSKPLIKKADELISQYDIKTPSPLTPVKSLSGGNKQKVIVARELSRISKLGELLIIAENPTIGLDVSTTEFVRKELLKMRNTQVGILLISSDLREIQELSDKIAVIYKGTIVGEVEASQAKREEIGLMMGGVTPNKKGDGQK